MSFALTGFSSGESAGTARFEWAARSRLPPLRLVGWARIEGLVVMRERPVEILDYAGEPRRRVAVVAWQSVVAGAGGYVLIPTFMCACGHLGAGGLVATLPALVLSWVGIFAAAIDFGAGDCYLALLWEFRLRLLRM